MIAAAAAEVVDAVLKTAAGRRKGVAISKRRPGCRTASCLESTAGSDVEKEAAKRL